MTAAAGADQPPQPLQPLQVWRRRPYLVPMTQAQPPTQREIWSGAVGEAWAEYAAQLDAMLAAVSAAALARAGFAPGARVLDIGCGAGATSLEIAKRVAPGGAVIGVDLSPQLLAIARARFADAAIDATFVEADASQYKASPKADAAFSRFGVMFFDDPVRAFAHLRAQLNPGGKLVFICWRAFAENLWAAAPLDAIRPMITTPAAPADPHAPGPFALADAARIEHILSGAGWRAIDIAPWSGDVPIAGGADLARTADFMMRIGPCARAMTDHGLDPVEVKRRLIAALTPHSTAAGVLLPAACWIVSAQA